MGPYGTIGQWSFFSWLLTGRTRPGPKAKRLKRHTRKCKWAVALTRPGYSLNNFSTIKSSLKYSWLWVHRTHCRCVFVSFLCVVLWEALEMGPGEQKWASKSIIYIFLLWSMGEWGLCSRFVQVRVQIFGISRDILRGILCDVEIHCRFVPGFEKSSTVHCRMRESDVKMVFQHPAPSSRQSVLLPFVEKKARSVITDVTKLDVVSDGLLHNQLLHFCQNARMAFLGRNTPTPLLSGFMAQVDATIVEAVCRHGTGGGHVDWSPHLRKFANMKTQVPHFRGGFGITPNEGSAISAFYSATCALVVWLGSHKGNKPAQDFADVWAPGLNFSSPNSWHAPLLQALPASHALLLQDYGCVEWTSESDRVPAPLAVSIALPFVPPSVGSRNSPPPSSSWARGTDY